MTKDESGPQPNLEQLKAAVNPILRSHGVERAYMFGSRARGEAAAGSDLDLLVRYAKPKTFFEVHALTSELEQAVGMKVDLVSEKALKKSILMSIKKDLIPLWGKRAHNFKDLTGQRFGRLIARRPTDKRRNGWVVWICECDCGKFIEASATLLTQNKVKSCGCLALEKQSMTGKEAIQNNNFGWFEGTEISQIKNKKPRKDTKTGQKGVRFKKQNGKYHANIRLKHRNYHLGYFDTFEEAREARLEAEKLLFEPMIKRYEEKQGNGAKAAETALE